MNVLGAAFIADRDSIAATAKDIAIPEMNSPTMHKARPSRDATPMFTRHDAGINAAISIV